VKHTVAPLRPPHKADWQRDARGIVCRAYEEFGADRLAAHLECDRSTVLRWVRGDREPKGWAVLGCLECLAKAAKDRGAA
jgi:hypothetical protein